MARAFSTIAYTPSVRRAQERYGSRTANEAFDLDPQRRDRVSQRDAEFIATVETFFMASRGENGWPYVQHRGGPRGFLKVLDEETIGFADFSGNRQYISSGNIANDDRVMLILIDFATRRRLKIWGRARIVHEREEPELIARLEVPTYRARVERGFLIKVEAFDFNCPQHIVQRWSEEELNAIAATRTPAATPAVLGSGPLELAVTGMRQLAPKVRAYELRSASGAALPEVTAGAHLALPVRLEDGSEAVRHYSIATARKEAWEIAVLRNDQHAGGSAALHRDYQLGTVLRCAPPRNDFHLHDDDRPAVLIAGGIGITAIKPMAAALAARGAKFEMHYAARSRALMAYRDELPATCRTWFSDEGKRLDIGQLVSTAATNTVFYVCGPERLIEEVRAKVADADRVRFERFAPPTPSSEDKPVELVLRRSGLTLHVPADRSLLDAIDDAGVALGSDCRVGNCGSCAVKVLAGEPDHRDLALTRSERESAALMCPCVSRARTASLVLDL
jgi:hypothetical protein